MQSSSTYLPCYKTNAFSALVTDYVSGKNDLKDFYAHAPNFDGIKQAIENRKLSPLHISPIVSPVIFTSSIKYYTP